MGQGPNVRDRFANYANIEVVESAAGVLTFSSLNTNMGFLGRRDQALAMAIDELQYFIPEASLAAMSASADFVKLALTVSDQVTDLENLTDRRILHNFLFKRIDSGAAASHVFVTMPVTFQFFPPIISAERTIFLAVDSQGLAGALTFRLRILFRVETLTGAELVELAEVFRLTS